jgi:hypothetical protein
MARAISLTIFLLLETDTFNVQCVPKYFSQSVFVCVCEREREMGMGEQKEIEREKRVCVSQAHFSLKAKVLLLLPFKS